MENNFNITTAPDLDGAVVCTVKKHILIEYVELEGRVYKVVDKHYLLPVTSLDVAVKQAIAEKNKQDKKLKEFFRKHKPKKLKHLKQTQFNYEHESNGR